MPSMTTQGIVLRHADYREHDRMLTLLTPAHGRIDALCRGCKRPQSPLLSASEWFALGEYVLYTGKGRMTVTSCSLTEGFYPLRTHYECLQYATYLLSVAEAAAQPGEEAAQLFTLLARSLTRLAYSNRDARAVVAAFLALSAAIGRACRTACSAEGPLRTKKFAALILPQAAWSVPPAHRRWIIPCPSPRRRLAGCATCCASALTKRRCPSATRHARCWPIMWRRGWKKSCAAAGCSAKSRMRAPRPA